jgi:hypothetical protein
MICPYICSPIIQKMKNIYDENGLLTSWVFAEKKQQAECKESECAVWKDGKCNYNG